MENQNQNQDVVAISAPIVKPTETKEFLMSPIGQELKQFELMQRMAQVYTSSTIVPKTYQGQQNMGNVIIALDMAKRMGANPLLVMQNLYVVYGNPSWSSKFLIATFNQCGKYEPIHYEERGQQGTDQWAMRAYSYNINDKEHKEPLYGEWVSIDIAKKEGWYSKSGSKWQTIPGQMLRYRSAAWFINTIAPELSMGLSTVDEMEDRNITDVDFEEVIEKPKQRVGFTPQPQVTVPERPQPEAVPEQQPVQQPKAQQARPTDAKQFFG